LNSNNATRKLFFNVTKDCISFVTKLVHILMYIIMAVVAAKLIRASLCTIRVLRASISISSVFTGYMIAHAKNPRAKSENFPILILGFALVEATALFCLLMTFLILFAF